MWHFLPLISLHCVLFKGTTQLNKSLLYSKIHLRWWSSQSPLIGLLFRSILPRPEPASFIQSLVLDGDTIDVVESTSRAPQILVNETELFHHLEHDSSIFDGLRGVTPHMHSMLGENHVNSLSCFLAIFLDLTCFGYIEVFWASITACKRWCHCSAYKFTTSPLLHYSLWLLTNVPRFLEQSAWFGSNFGLFQNILGYLKKGVYKSPRCKGPTVYAE
jgi:hypothetical protein